MFTGLVEGIGTVTQVKPFAGGRRFRIIAPDLATALQEGESIACNGVCLTVERVARGFDDSFRPASLPQPAAKERSATDSSEGSFLVTAVEESLRRTTAGRWRRGQKLHLERALSLSARLGGHLVQGHIDGIAGVARAGREGREFVLTIRVPGELGRYIVPKGSLAVDGVSLTVGDLRGSLCRLYIIPETLRRTQIGSLRPGDQVNLETDLIAKYVESLSPREGRTRRG